MLRSIKQLYGDKLRATDGDIGRVRDFYFDDQNWAVRYLVADTGAWLPGRQVLLSPHSLGRLDQAECVLAVNLTRRQIEHSPSIESHKPVSRQYEEEYFRYFGWPYYWQGDALWGLSGCPVIEQPAGPITNRPALASVTQPERPDAHLRSTQAVSGYHVRSGEDIIGHVCDFMMDAAIWKVGQVAVKTGPWLSDREALIPTSRVGRISFEESTVFLNMTKAEVEQESAPHVVPAGAGDSHLM